MKMKLIVPLLAICLILSVVSVQAQTNTADMDSMNVIVTENIAKTITCNMTGNAAVIGNMNVAGKMENMTGNMSNTPKTGTVTGKIAIIKSLDNMPGKVVIIGKMDNIPGKVIMVGKMNNMPEMDEHMKMPGIDGNIGNLTEKMGNVTIIMAGNMTATVTLDMTGNMDNMTGNMANMTGNMNNMTGMSENMDNMGVLMTGNMTATVTGDMTRKVVVIKNIGNMTEMIGNMCKMHGMAGNMTNMTETAGNMSDMTGTAGNMSNMTGPMTCDMTGTMLIFRDMDSTRMDESMEMVKISEDMTVLGKMSEETGEMENMFGMDGKIYNTAEMDEKMSEMENITKKILIIQKMDDTTQVMTKTFTCNITEKTIQIENMGNMAGINGKISNMTENM